MAKNNSTVYLGFEDEEITVKHLGLMNSIVNKVGGLADWPTSDIKVPLCALCGTTRPLIVQLYAPLELSQFHRTLYIFACLNPACSQNSKAWTCIRTQHLDTQTLDIITAVGTTMIVGNNSSGKKKQKNVKALATKINWCSGADDWDENSEETVEEMDTAADEENEENGNFIAKNDNSPKRIMTIMGASLIGSDAEDALEGDDDEDESNSMENDIICGFSQLDVHGGQVMSTEDPNANCAAGVAGAAVGVSGATSVAVSVSVGGASATICAEIEGSETDVVLVETPKKPERDLVALLKHTSTPAALGPLAKITDVTLKPFFIAVDIEQWQSGQQNYDQYGGLLAADHIHELYQEYKRRDEAAGHSPLGAAGGGSSAEDMDVYEKALPAHGDFIFHQFVSTIQQNPGQIIRYSRDTLPLLITPLTENVPKCPNCNGDTICEIQILPTLIPKLRLQQNNETTPIEFGNVLVFTCLKSCWDTPDKMRYERVIVQVEK